MSYSLLRTSYRRRSTTAGRRDRPQHGQQDRCNKATGTQLDETPVDSTASRTSSRPSCDRRCHGQAAVARRKDQHGRGLGSVRAVGLPVCSSGRSRATAFFTRNRPASDTSPHREAEKAARVNGSSPAPPEAGPSGRCHSQEDARRASASAPSRSISGFRPAASARSSAARSISRW